jgi:lysylphosphatidylglycerol synthetase-like protein (DUF2156 family)
MRYLTPSQRRCFNDIVQYGEQSLSYFHLQDGLEYRFFDRGFISTATNNGLFGCFGLAPFTFGLGNPVTPRGQTEEVIGTFIEEQKRRAVFLQLNDDAAAVFARNGYDVNVMGTEALIDLAHFEVAGRKMKNLKSSRNQGNKLGINVREMNFQDIDGQIVRRISREWRASKTVKNRELRFLSYPPYFDDEVQCRKFFAFSPQGEMLGYAFFCPYFRNGAVIGYTANIIRQKKAAPGLLRDYIILRAIERFQIEGVPHLSLGICPFHNVEGPERFTYNNAVKQHLMWLYARGDRFYHFRDLAFHKSRYYSEAASVYVAMPRGSSIRVVWAGLQLCNIIGFGRLGRDNGRGSA